MNELVFVDIEIGEGLGEYVLDVPTGHVEPGCGHPIVQEHGILEKVWREE